MACNPDFGSPCNSRDSLLFWFEVFIFVVLWRQEPSCAGSLFCSQDYKGKASLAQFLPLGLEWQWPRDLSGQSLGMSSLDMLAQLLCTLVSSLLRRLAPFPHLSSPIQTNLFVNLTGSHHPNSQPKLRRKRPAVIYLHCSSEEGMAAVTNHSTEFESLFLTDPQRGQVV